jgi:hypothetical protein
LLLFTIAALIGFYLLTKNEPARFKQILWPMYGTAAVIFLIGLFVIQPDTTGYILWVQFFFLILLIPLFALVIRFIWVESSQTPAWIRYTLSVPVSLLFLFTLWICWNAFPVLIYIF